MTRPTLTSGPGTALRLLSGLLAMMLLHSCFTGVESTPRITERDVRAESLPSRADAAADTLSRRLSALRGEPWPEWKPGKTFVVTDPRVGRRMLEVPTPPVLEAGDTLVYTGWQPMREVTGDTTSVLMFSAHGQPVAVKVDRNLGTAAANAPLPLPMTVETYLIDRANTLLEPLRRDSCWVLTTLWQNPATGQATDGHRYVPVKYDRVVAGMGVNPLRLLLADASGRSFCLETDATALSRPVRPLSALVALMNPRLKYPLVSDANWELIKQGRVTIGMTRDECRLALGAPADIVREGGRDHVREAWSYDTGTFLLFEDGLLIRKR